MATDFEKSGQILKSCFGYGRFRGNQEEVILAILAGRDVSVVKPTGSGKSVCYQIPAIIKEGTGIVISPLIALMKDQVDGLRQNGIAARFLNSTLSSAEQQSVVKEARSGSLDLLYLAPERLAMSGFSDFLEQIKPNLFAIDEAHCVSQWGHDFRPDYLSISRIIDKFPAVTRSAFTATADSTIRKDIVEKLHLRKPAEFVESFDRPNIQYRVEVREGNAKEKLIRFINSEFPGKSGIVYVGTRKKTESTAQWLNEKGIKALPYHAGLEREEREQNQEKFNSDEIDVIVATIAFGMGVDKPDVRFVVHLDLPKNIESYYQETGRAGRDGKSAMAWMLYSLADIVKNRVFIESGAGDAAYKKIQLQKLNSMLGYCESVECRRITLLAYFDEARTEKCGNCDSCLNPVEKWDGTIAFQKVFSAIKRTGERFGAGHIVDILRGKSTVKILKWKHDQLPTFGCGEDLSEREWFSVVRQLLSLGIILPTDHSGLCLADEAYRALKGKREFFFRKDILGPLSSSTKSKRVYSAEEIELDSTGERIFEKLREFRLKKSKELRLPPYAIFHDRTMNEIAHFRPHNSLQLGEIYGVGEAKLEKFGSDILGIVQEFQDS